EAGYRKLVSRSVSIDLAAFYNRYDHLLSVEQGAVSLDASPPPPHLVFPIVEGNGLKGTTSGLEIVPDWKPAPWWRLQGSYAYLNMNLKTRPGSTDTSTVTSTEGSNPRHQVSVRSFLDLPGRMEFSQNWRYI